MGHPGRTAKRTVGFIGVGEMAAAMVEGLVGDGDHDTVILLSPRGATRAAEMADSLPGVRVCAHNQSVVDGCDVLVISLRPDDAEPVLKDLTVAPGSSVVSVMAGVSSIELTRLLGSHVEIVRAVPSLAVRWRAAVTPVFPPRTAGEILFDQLGTVWPLSAEELLTVASATAGTVSTHLAMLAEVASWAAAHGLPTEQTQTYVRSMLAELAPDLGDTGQEFARLMKGHETPGGINEQVRETWFNSENRASLRTALDGVLERLRR